MIKLTDLLKEADEKEPSSITVKSSISKQIVKMAFEQESPNTKYKINGQEFEFNFRSFCKNWHDSGIGKDQAWKTFFAARLVRPTSPPATSGGWSVTAISFKAR